LNKYETFIIKENTLGQWEGALESSGVYENDEWVRTPAKMEVLGHEPSVDTIFTRADQYIESNYPELTRVIVQSARWHKDDASPKQVDLLRRYRFPVIQEEGKFFLRDGMNKVPLTKGLAGKLITKKLNDFKQFSADRKRATA
jgi:hypothetical protein